MKSNNVLLSRAMSVGAVAVLIFALNTSGALAGFWRTFDGITANGVPNPSQFLYGFGWDGNNMGYGYGYGVEHGDFGYGYGYGSTPSNGGSNPSSGGGGGGGGSRRADNCPNGDTSGSRYDGKCDKSGSVPVDPSVPSDNYVKRAYPDEAKSATCGQSIVSFNDIDSNIFKQYIIDLEAKSGLNGNGSGENFDFDGVAGKDFQPNRTATRSEFLKLVMRALCIDYSSMSSKLEDFSDTNAEAWQAKVFNKAVDLDWITNENKFARVNDNVSRVEALKIIMRAGIASPLLMPETSSFADVAADSWEARYTENAKMYGIVNGQLVDGVLVYRPVDAVLRGESAKIIMNTLY